MYTFINPYLLIQELEMLKRNHKELELELSNYKEQLTVKDRLIEVTIFN